jgi:hypothetical protein
MPRGAIRDPHLDSTGYKIPHASARLGLSPGPDDPSGLPNSSSHLNSNANMWRIVNDSWDWNDGPLCDLIGGTTGTGDGTSTDPGGCSCDVGVARPSRLSLALVIIGLALGARCRRTPAHARR